MTCASVCEWVFVRALREKTTRAIDTKLGTHILCDMTSACIDPEVKRSRSVKVNCLLNALRMWEVLVHFENAVLFAIFKSSVTLMDAIA